MATLQIQLPDSGAVTHELSTDVISIGWADDNLIPIKDASVSRRHAQIVREGDRFVLKDLGSTNKSWINGAAVSEMAINDADNIRFGNVECVFRLNGTSGKTTMASGAAMLGRVVLSVPGKGEVTYKLDQDVVSVGWKSSNNIRIQEPSISGNHAQFLRVNNRYRLKDLGSTNKTFINGHSIIEAELSTGDKVRFGAVEGVFKGEMRIPIVQPGNLGKAAEPLDTPKSADEFEISPADHDQLVEQLKAAQKEKADFAKQLAEARTTTDVTALDEELKARQAQIETLSGQRATLEETTRKLSSQLKEARKQIDLLTVEREVVQGAGTHAVEKMAEVEKRIEMLTKERDELKAKIETLEKQAEQAPKQLTEVIGQRDALQANATALTSQLAEVQSKLDALLKERDSAQSASAEAAKRLAVAQQQIEALQKECEAARTQSEEVSTRLKELEAIAQERENWWRNSLKRRVRLNRRPSKPRTNSPRSSRKRGSRSIP